METTLIEEIIPSRASKKSKAYWHSYNQKRIEYLLKKQQEYRSKQQSLKPPKTPSIFQQTKTQQLLKLLVNHRSFVPVPVGLKHPIIKNWNANNYWYNKPINLKNLERGCVRIIQNNWNNCYIGWLDIDQKKWTKIAKKYHCGYLKSPKGNIRIPFPFRTKNPNQKTGTLYFQSKKIGDAKISGEVMLPGQAYYDKNGKFLGYYEWKHWGTFFPKQNYIFANPQEFWDLLKQDFGIEHKSISQHFIIQKTHWNQPIYELKLGKTSVKDPPWQKFFNKKITSENRI